MHPHSWRALHTDSPHPQVTPEPFPTSIKHPLLRTISPSSLHHPHLTSGSRNASALLNPLLCSSTLRALLHCFPLPGILLLPKLFASPVTGQHSKLSLRITFSRKPSSIWQLDKMPLLNSHKLLCLPQLPEFNVTSQPAPPFGPHTLGGHTHPWTQQWCKDWLLSVCAVHLNSGAQNHFVGLLSGHSGRVLPSLLGPEQAVVRPV